MDRCGRDGRQPPPSARCASARGAARDADVPPPSRAGGPARSGSRRLAERHRAAFCAPTPPRRACEMRARMCGVLARSIESPGRASLGWRSSCGWHGRGDAGRVPVMSVEVGHVRRAGILLGASLCYRGNTTQPQLDARGTAELRLASAAVLSNEARSLTATTKSACVPRGTYVADMRASSLVLRPLSRARVCVIPPHPTPAIRCPVHRPPIRRPAHPSAAEPSHPLHVHTRAHAHARTLPPFAFPHRASQSSTSASRRRSSALMSFARPSPAWARPRCSRCRRCSSSSPRPAKSARWCCATRASWPSRSATSSSASRCT
mmetsp:Transcript_13210/g.55332  ORF Transcript_13210/g.55332 Transcript_13210/m.55332 type:complete len:320 (+) Transcript_13210:406-1365(+)